MPAAAATAVAAAAMISRCEDDALAFDVEVSGSRTRK
jgi:hypothetical protein